ncbi:MAG: type 4a pilus biogenesis protein PilO [Deltaproteobacteria bacterium]|jgi:type IV pilus assembly protein PilO|nr:type 4a pilus biogenesis protein PilO [Deltaproteobacteria bacterium]
MAPPAPPKASAASAQGGFAGLPDAAKAAIGLFLLAAIGIVYYVAFHGPVEEEILNAQQQHAQLEERMNTARQRQAQYLQLREELASREALDRANLRVLPEDAEMAAFLQDLNRLAEISGLRMRLVEPRPEEPQEQYVRLPVALHLSGRYHQLSRFFYNVSRLERAISMENIELTEPTVTEEDVVLTVQVLATTFRRPSEADAAAAATGG